MLELLIRTLGTNFNEILSEIHIFSFKKMFLKMSSGKWRPLCFGLNVLIYIPDPAPASAAAATRISSISIKASRCIFAAIGLCINILPLFRCRYVILMASQMTGNSIGYSTDRSGCQQIEHHSSTLLPFVRGIHWWPVHSLHKRLVRKTITVHEFIIWLIGNVSVIIYHNNLA